MTEKIIGYILIAFGVIAIIGCAFNGYNIFNKKSPVIPIFSNQTFENQKNTTAEALQMALGMSPQEMTFSLNLVMHLVLLGFIANVGFKLASVGTSLVRPIVVDLSAKGLKNKKES